MSRTKTTTDAAGRRRLAGAVTWSLLLLLGAVLMLALSAVPPGDAGLVDAALRHLERSGVENPVTAVLMSYRAYDTLLEIGVLFLALLGVWSAAVMPPQSAAEPASLVLRFLNQLLVPFLILFAGYFLWAGSREPGGAFQAGAVVAAAGVLMTLSGIDARLRVPPPAHRALLVVGLGTFTAAGIGAMVAGNAFLEFPAPYAKALILAVETAATISIGLTLLAVFRGGRPRGSDGERG